MVGERNIFPLIVSIKYGRNEITKILLNNNADPNIKDYTGETPLFKYLKLSYYTEEQDLNFFPFLDLEIFTLLLKKGAIIEESDTKILEKVLYIYLTDERFTVQKLVFSMRLSGLFNTEDNNQPSKAEILYNKLPFIKEDYPDFASFSGADKFITFFIAPIANIQNNNSYIPSVELSETKNEVPLIINQFPDIVD